MAVRQPRRSGPRRSSVLHDDRRREHAVISKRVNPARNVGAAGFLACRCSWQLDDESPTALCPVVVRPVNFARGGARRARHRSPLPASAPSRLASGVALKDSHQGSRAAGRQATLPIAATAPGWPCSHRCCEHSPRGSRKLGLAAAGESIDKSVVGSLGGHRRERRKRAVLLTPMRHAAVSARTNRWRVS